ncbi:MAG TPA: UrcA family protein [Allosphingosinicella sp.]
MNRMLSAIAALAVTAGTLTLAAPAYAGPREEALSISIEGLNPANPADVAQIDRKVRTAARNLCGSDLIQPVGMRAKAAACEEAVVADARSAVRLAAARQATPFRLALRAR